jgi:hypothetical protein
MPEYKQILDKQRKDVVDWVLQCAEESRTNEKDKRRPQNQKNWQYYHGQVDWSHKREGDPRIHLHKFGVAAERMRAKFKSALMKYDNWIAVQRIAQKPDAIVNEYVAKNALVSQFEGCDAKTVISDAILCGGVESRMSLKIGGKQVTKPRFTSKDGKLVKEEKTYWSLDLTNLPFENYLCDTFDPKRKLFEIEEFMTDHYLVRDLASEEQTADKPYRLEAVDAMKDFGHHEAEEEKKIAEGNPEKRQTNRKRVQNLIQNFYGTILDNDGKVYMWKTEDGTEIPLRNVMCVVGNESELLVDPKRVTRWSGKAPFVTADPIRSPGTGRKALLDAGVDLNEAADEFFTLLITGGIKAAHNVTWYREDWFADKKQASGGIKDGDQIAIDSSAPAGAVPMGVLKTGEVPQDAMMMFQTLERAFAENVISNQLDLSGNMPGKQVRSTEIITANSAISDVFDSMAADIEDIFIEKLAIEAFYEIMQHVDDMDPDEVRSWFGTDQGKAEQFLKMSTKDRFADIEGSFKFYGRGMKGLMANAAKAQAAINYMSTLTANPITAQQVESQISVAKIGLVIARGLGLDLEEIQPDAQERALIDQKQAIREQALAQAELEGGGGGPNQGRAGTPSQTGVGSMPQPGPQQGM